MSGELLAALVGGLFVAIGAWQVLALLAQGMALALVLLLGGSP